MRRLPADRQARVFERTDRSIAVALGVPPALPGDFGGIVDLVRRQLEEEILAGSLPAGTPLLQRQIAQRLGVSREPVRQALRILENEGLLEARPRRSSVVAGVSMKTIVDVYEVRAQLDTLVAARAASDRSCHAELLPVLSQILARAQDTSITETSVFAQLDAAFHAAIYRASGNEFATDIFRRHATVIRRVFSTIAASGWVDRSWPEHSRIRDAIVAGDAEAAAEISRAHVATASQWLLTYLANNRVIEPSL
jgi:DNA-binding GntR family transcriptional regulator